MTDHDFHRRMRELLPQVKPIGMDPCLFANKQTSLIKPNKTSQAGVKLVMNRRAA
jgi:hypothetical protein